MNASTPDSHRERACDQGTKPSSWILGKPDVVQKRDSGPRSRLLARIDAVEALVRRGMPRVEAIKQVARRRGLSKRAVYD